MPAYRSPLKGPLLVLGGALCFSTLGFTQAVFVGDGATPQLTATLRMAAGGLALLAWCAMSGRLPRREGWSLTSVLLCCLATIGYQLLFLKGTQVAGVAAGTVISIGTTPVAAAILSVIFLNQRPLPIWYPATLLALAGTALLCWHEGTIRPENALPPMASGFLYALYMTACRPLTRYQHPETILMVLLLASSVLMIPLLEGERLCWLASSRGMLFTLHLGVVTVGLGYALTLEGLRVCPATTAGTLGLAEPLGAVALAFLCLGEEVTALSLAGVACVLLSTLSLILLPDVGMNERPLTRRTRVQDPGRR